MNLIIIICSIAVTLYVLSETYTTISGYIAEWKLERAEKKRLDNDLYAYKVKKVLLTAYECGLQSGLTQRQAQTMAIRYIKDVEKAGLIDVKYNIIRGNYERTRTKTSC
jgi:hypothetical protein